MESIIVRTFETPPLVGKFSDNRAIICYPDYSSEAVLLEKDLGNNLIPLMKIFNSIYSKGYRLVSSTCFEYTLSIRGVIGHEYVFTKE